MTDYGIVHMLANAIDCEGEIRFSDGLVLKGARQDGNMVLVWLPWISCGLSFNICGVLKRFAIGHPVFLKFFHCLFGLV